MKSIGVLTGVVVLAVVVSGLMHLALASSEPSPEVEQLQARLAALETALEDAATERSELLREIASVREQANSMTGQASRTPAESVEEIVARMFEENRATSGLTAASSAESPEPEEEWTVHDALTALRDPTLTEMEREELLKKIRDAGLVDALIAELEQQVEANPNDPALRVELGIAYLQPIMDGEAGPLAGQWAMRADAAFDQALAIDPGHWDARFSKAVSLSFWPPVFGKQAEAIAQFETLIEQQRGLERVAGHADPYLFLGNLYQQSGKDAEALEVWRQGLLMFPDHADLARQLEIGSRP